MIEFDHDFDSMLCLHSKKLKIGASGSTSKVNPATASTER